VYKIGCPKSFLTSWEISRPNTGITHQYFRGQSGVSQFWYVTLILAEIAAWPTTQLIQLETLRLLPPAPIAKSTGKEPRTLRVGEKTIVIPANTLLIPNHVAIHTHPHYWGPDRLVRRTSRWIQSEALTSGGDPNNALDVDSITTPHKGSFIACRKAFATAPGRSSPRPNLSRLWRVCFVISVSIS
jgi:hypothetical protein